MSRRLLGRISLASLVSWFAISLAAGIVVLTLIPAAVWRHPANDAVYRGFDPNLIYVSQTGPAPRSGVVDVSTGSLTITANPGSHPTVHLVTTPLSYLASFDIEISRESAGSIPLRIEVWSPATAAGYRLVFDSEGDVIREQTVAGADRSQDLVGGIVGIDRALGNYVVGRLYHVSVDVDQTAHQIRARIAGAGSLDASTSVAPALLAGFRPSLTLSSSGAAGSAIAVITNYAVTLPSQPANTAESTVKVDDPRARGLSQAVWLACIALTLLAAAAWLWPRLRRARPSAMSKVMRARLPVAAVIGLIGAAYLIANLPLFGLGSPHFDIFAAKVWSYVAFKYGFGDLYYRTLLVPAAAPWLGVPVHEATFPYGITKAYYYLTAGWIHGTWLNPGDQNIAASFSFEQLLKGLNVLFGFVDAGLVYLIAKPFMPRGQALWSAVLVGLNPAFLFVMSIWGSTESISLFFVLGSIWMAERSRPLGAWLMLAAGAYTRPQMLVLAFLLGLVYLRRFGPSQTAGAVAWTVIVSFLFIGPFAIAISPSLPVDYVARTFAYHIGNGQADVAYLGISPGHFSIWTLPLLLVSGAHGLERMWSPSTLTFAGAVSYGQVGAALSIGFLMVVGALLLLGSRIYGEPAQYLVIVAFGLLGWLLVTPGVISRYLLYATVLVILCRRAFSLTGYVGAVGVLTLTALAGIYGQFSLDFVGYSGDANVLSPLNNAVSRFLFELFASDQFITLASISNLAVLVALGAKAWAGLRRERVRDLAAASTGA